MGVPVPLFSFLLEHTLQHPCRGLIRAFEKVAVYVSVVVLVLACPARPATVTSGTPAAICIVILVCLNECTLRCGRPAAFSTLSTQNSTVDG